MPTTLLDLDPGKDAAARLSTGILAGTPVLTLEGEIPVQFLAPGDRVITRAGARQVTHVSVRVIEDADVVCVSASALGHDRPSEEVFLAPGQPVLVRDWRAMALYNTPQAAVPVARLADGEFIRRGTLPEARLFTLHFAAEAVIYAGGLELACDPVTVPA